MPAGKSLALDVVAPVANAGGDSQGDEVLNVLHERPTRALSSANRTNERWKRSLSSKAPANNREICSIAAYPHCDRLSRLRGQREVGRQVRRVDGLGGAGKCTVGRGTAELAGWCTLSAPRGAGRSSARALCDELRRTRRRK